MAISSNTTGLRPGVCTSTSRPSSPYEGQSIYQTDTDTVLFWDGTAWVAPYATTAALNLKANIASPTFTGTPAAPTPSNGTNTTQIATMASRPWNIAWGVAISPPSATTSISFGTTELISNLSTTFTAVANRYYRITYYEPQLQTSATASQFTVMRIRQGSITGTQLQYGVLNGETSTGTIASQTVVYVGIFTAGSQTIVPTLTGSTTGNTATRTATSPAQLVIEDIGPV